MRRRHISLVGALICLQALAACGGSGPARPAYRLAWADEFDGAAGQAPQRAWSPVSGGGGWGNQELECYTNVPGNESLDGSGRLAITAIRQPGHICSDGASNDYTSARLQTLGRFSLTYGKVQVRALLPTGSGAWPAIWAQGVDYPSAGWPHCGEIDISEVVGSHPRDVRGSLHGPKSDGSPYDLTNVTTLPVDVGSAFHVYGLQWTPTDLSMSVDGKTYATYSRQQVEAAGGWPFDKPFYLLLDLAVGGTLPGAPDATAVWPQKMLVDYVRVYRPV